MTSTCPQHVPKNLSTTISMIRRLCHQYLPLDVERRRGIVIATRQRLESPDAQF